MTDTPTVVEAICRVMADVQAVKKADRNQIQKYNFRGIDAVVNAVGPELRKHGVVIVPVSSSYDEERYQTSKGSQMRGVTMKVRYRIYGPAGDFIEAETLGESSDSGDKAIPKAHSVAFRTMLLQALCIPTDEPDPDADSHDRAEANARDSYVSGVDNAALLKAAKDRGITKDQFTGLLSSLVGKRFADLTLAEIPVVREAIDNWSSGDVDIDSGMNTPRGGQS